MAKDENLSAVPHKDGKFTIYGKTENITSYFKKITEFISKNSKIINK
jgi:hypothetical protein